MKIKEKPKEEKIEEEIVELKLKKEKEEEEEKAEIILKKPEKPKEKEEVEVEEKIKIPKKPKKKEEIEEKVELKIKEKPKEEKVEEEVVEFKLKKEKEEEEKAEIILKKPEKPKEKEEVEVEEKIKIPKKPKKKEEVEEKVDLKIKEKPKEEKVEEELVELKLKKKKEEEEKAEIILKKPEKPKEEVEVEEKIKIPKKPKKKEEAEEKIEIKIKEKPKEEKFEEEIVEFKLKKEKEIEEEKAEIIIKKPEKPIEKEEVTIEEKVKIRRRPKKKEEVEEKIDVKIKEKPKEVKVEEEFVEFKLKREIEEEEEAKIVLKKPTKPKEEEEIQLTIEKKKEDYEVKEEAAEITIKREVEEMEEDKKVIRRRVRPTPKEEVVVEEKLTIPKKPKIKDVKEEEEAELIIEKKREEEYEISEEKVELTIKKEVIVEEIKERKPIIIEKELPEIPEKKLILPSKELPRPKEEEEEAIVLKKPKKPYEIEEIEEKAEIKIPKKEEKKIEEEEVYEKVKIPKKKVKIPKEEEEEALKIKKEEEIEEKLEMKVPKKEKLKEVAAEEVEETLIMKKERKREEITEEVKITIRKEIEEEVGEEVEYVALAAHVGEGIDDISLVEGERVYIIERTTHDVWFVKKTLTRESGYIPARVLTDSVSYTHYLREKLEEKISQLPSVFQRPKPGEKLVAPKFVQKLQPTTVTDGQPAELQCQVRGNPRPMVTWFRQTAIIRPSEEFQIYYDEDNTTTLQIREVFPEDAGTYTVVAKNAAGFASCSADLTVQVPPSEQIPMSRRSLSRESSLADILEGFPPVFAKKPKDKTVDEGTVVDLICKVCGVPEPQVTWKHNGKILKESNRTSIKVKVDTADSYTLMVKIKDASPIDSGLYEIVATNTEGKTTTSLTLTVCEIPKPARITKKPEPTIKIKEKEDVEFTCTFTGKPKPTVHWTKGRREVIQDVRHVVTVTETTTTLIIKSCELSDRDTYLVTVSNPAGHDSADVVLKVEERPPDKLPPIFTQTYSDVTVVENTPIFLTAKVTGIPPPKVTWLKDDVPLKPSKNTKISHDKDTVSLEIIDSSPYRDTGVYKCVATNPEGTAEHTAKVTVQRTGLKFIEPLQDVEVKERESALFVVRVSHEDAEVTWHKDGEQLTPGDKHKFVKEGPYRKLVISDTQVKDEGEYTCVLGELETSADLIVVELPPEITSKMVDVKVAKDETATFQVELTKGDALVRWFKNGTELQITERVQLKIAGKKQKLIIYNTTYEDAGTYKCVVGDKSCTATLRVEAPTVEFRVRLPEKTTAPQDTDVTFTVDLSRPDADVTWLKSSKPINERDKRYKVTEDGTSRTLVIRSVRKEDSAEYTCVSGNVRTSTKLKVEEVSAEFTLKLRDVTVRESDTATLLVEVTREILEVRWFRGEDEIVPTARLLVESEGKRRRLIIKDTTLDDMADYTCALEDKRCSSKLTVEAPPRVTTDERKLRVRRGEPVELDVPFIAYPPPRVEWTFEDQPLPPIAKTTVENLRTTLTIKKSEDSNVGTYSLKLTNRIGEVNVDFTLTIIDKPKPPGCPEASEITDDSMTLSWKAPESDGGAPITNYLIEYHDRSTLRWTTYNETFTIVERHHRVTKLQPGNDYMFRVIAVNEAGKSDPSPGTKYITVTLPRVGEPPVVVEQLQDTVAGLKARVKMQCRITGQPVPATKWLKNGKEMMKIRTVSTAYETQVASLTISETTEKSAGLYTCKASNPLGEAETSATLKIQEPPKAEFDPAMKNVRVKANNEYVLTIKTSGYPAPDVRWLRNGQPLLSTRHTLVSIHENTTSITIRTVTAEDSAIYTVWLTNEAGSASHDFRLKVLDKPMAPEGPMTFPKIDKESITISWNPPEDDGGSDVTNYVVEKCDVRRKVWMEVTTVRSDVTTYAVQDLTEDTEYQFRVSAVNEYGRGEPLTSEKVTAKSQFDRPSAPTGPFKISNMTERSLTLAWEPPESDGGSPITEYTVERREAGRRAWTKVGTTDGRSLVMDVLGLRPDQEYDFRVSARNVVGQGPPYTSPESIAPGAQISPPSSPVGPLTVISMTTKSVTITWRPPLSTGGADLLGYVVEKREVRERTWTRVASLEPHVTSYTIHNLTESREYFFRVFAENLAGLSPPLETEEPVKLTLRAERPSPPTAPLELHATGPTSIMVAWGRPESDGGAPLLGYTVVLKDMRRITWMEVGQVDADTQRLQIKDLVEGKEYLIRIIARNEVGSSDPLESEEPILVVRPPGFTEAPAEPDERTVSLSFSTDTTSSWMREANVEPLVRSYTRHVLIGRNEYFFRIWHYAESLFR